MILDRILDYAHELMKKAVQEGDIVIDGTCGNGYDTVLLANLVGRNGHVYGFDIQKEAVISTEQRLIDQEVSDRTTIIHDSHAHIKKYLKENHEGNIQAAIYNLGYLPGSDKSIITTPTETIASIENVLTSLKKGGLVVLVVYHGHSGGAKEKNALMDYVTTLDHKKYHVLNYGYINQKRTPPFILAIEKH